MFNEKIYVSMIFVVCVARVTNFISSCADQLSFPLPCLRCFVNIVATHFKLTYAWVIIVWFLTKHLIFVWIEIPTWPPQQNRFNIGSYGENILKLFWPDTSKLFDSKIDCNVPWMVLYQMSDFVYIWNSGQKFHTGSHGKRNKYFFIRNYCLCWSEMQDGHHCMKKLTGPYEKNIS